MELENYLSEIFDENIKIEEVSDTNCFPRYLLNFFNFYQCMIQNKKFTLLFLCDNKIIISRVKKHLVIIESITKNKSILVVNNVRRETRNKMIANGIPFIDLNKQIYLPFIYLLLDDTRAKRTAKVKEFTPSTQMIFITLMLQASSDVNSSELRKNLKMSSMTISRGLRDLSSIELLKEKGNNTRKTYQRIDKEDFWEIGKKHMINPVHKKVYIKELGDDTNFLYSNESALANLTMLNTPKREIYAIDKKKISCLDLGQIIDEETAENNKNYIIELWKYNPLFLSTDGVNVDKYSLYSQLESVHDERIEIELGELLERK